MAGHQGARADQRRGCDTRTMKAESGPVKRRRLAVAASLAGALCLTACAFLEPTPPAPPPEPVPEADIPPPPPLGAPASRTEAPPATIWHYASQDCEVDVYFYLDLQNRVMRALHYEVRSNDIVEQRPERCFQQLVDEHRQRSGASAAYSPR